MGLHRRGLVLVHEPQHYVVIGFAQTREGTASAITPGQFGCQ
jgi:hypothetical protein